MPTPSCRDALSREISDPVYDPLTGRCYRNPCAAEEDGVLDWAPGCVQVEQVYGSYDAGPGWASDVWWSEGGGGRRRRRHGGHGRRGGGIAPPHLSPPHLMRGPNGGGPGRRMGSFSRPGGSLSRPTSSIAYPSGPSPSYRSQPMQPMQQAPRSGGGYRAVSQPMQVATIRSAPMQAVSRPATSMARGMKGLGQVPPSVPRSMTQAEIDARFGNRFDPIYRFRQTWIDPPPSPSSYGGVPTPGSPVQQWVIRIASVVGALTAAGLTSRWSRSRATVGAAGAAAFLTAPMMFRPSFVNGMFSMR